MLDDGRGIFRHFQLNGRKKFPGRMEILRTFVWRGGVLKAFWQRENLPVVGSGTREKLRWQRKTCWICLSGGLWVCPSKAKALGLPHCISCWVLIDTQEYYTPHKQVNRKCNNSNKHRQRQYLLSAYHMLGFGLNALHVWCCLIIPTFRCKR